MQYTTVRILLVTRMTSTGSSSSTSSLCVGGLCEIYIYGMYVGFIYQGMKCTLTPLPCHINLVALQRVFLSLIPAAFQKQTTRVL